jgi:hypothetical protein
MVGRFTGTGRAGEVGTADPDPRCSLAERRRVEQAKQASLAAHQVPVPGVDRRGFDPYQYPSRAGNRRANLVNPEDIGRAGA